jgi:hypothetical protein
MVVNICWFLRYSRNNNSLLFKTDLFTGIAKIVYIHDSTSLSIARSSFTVVGAAPPSAPCGPELLSPTSIVGNPRPISSILSPGCENKALN